MPFFADERIFAGCPSRKRVEAALLHKYRVHALILFLRNGLCTFAAIVLWMPGAGYCHHPCEVAVGAREPPAIFPAFDPEKLLRVGTLFCSVAAGLGSVLASPLLKGQYVVASGHAQ